MEFAALCNALVGLVRLCAIHVQQPHGFPPPGRVPGGIIWRTFGALFPHGRYLPTHPTLFSCFCLSPLPQVAVKLLLGEAVAGNAAALAGQALSQSNPVMINLRQVGRLGAQCFVAGVWGLGIICPCCSVLVDGLLYFLRAPFKKAPPQLPHLFPVPDCHPPCRRQA